METVTNRELYNTINDLRKEIVASVQRLEDRMIILESEKLGGLESRIANIEGRMYVSAAIVGIVASAIVAALFKFILK